LWVVEPPIDTVDPHEACVVQKVHGNFPPLGKQLIPMVLGEIDVKCIVAVRAHIIPEADCFVNGCESLEVFFNSKVVYSFEKSISGGSGILRAFESKGLIGKGVERSNKNCERSLDVINCAPAVSFTLTVDKAFDDLTIAINCRAFNSVHGIVICIESVLLVVLLLLVGVEFCCCLRVASLFFVYFVQVVIDLPGGSSKSVLARLQFGSVVVK